MSIKNKLKKGFTLIETLIVIAIFGVVASATSVMFNGTRNEVVLDDAQATILNALERARSQSATGVGSTAVDHGIYIDVENNKIISFEGSSYSGTGKEMPLPPNISIIDPVADEEIIFNRLTAESQDITITLKNNISGETIDITVSQEGIIF